MTMGYSLDLAGAARRHLSAAQELDDVKKGVAKPHRAVAGYLYGIAAECSLKNIMRKSGIPLPPKDQKDGPYYAHFPQLKTMIRDCVSGRFAHLLRRYAEDKSLMNDWNVQMRYAPASEIQPKHIERWREQSERLLGEMEKC
jgi:hypothetical protein